MSGSASSHQQSTLSVLTLLSLPRNAPAHSGLPTPSPSPSPAPTTRATTSPASDREALCTFYNTVPPAGQALLTNWCGGKSNTTSGLHSNTTSGLHSNTTNGLHTDGPCVLEWLGVTCVNGSVTSVSLTDINLRGGSIPTQFGLLANLAVLRLDYNSLSSSIPSQLGLLTGLIEVNLVSNSLTGPIPIQLGGLTGLTTLALSDNSLLGPIPTQLGLLTGLTQLYLCCQRLDGSIPTQLGRLTGLLGLAICCNNLSGSIPSQLGGLTGLTELELDTNSLSGALPSALCSLKALTNLTVNANPLLTSYSQCLEALGDGFIKDNSLGPYIKPTTNPTPQPKPSTLPPSPHISTSSSGGGILKKLGGLTVVVVAAVVLGIGLLGGLGVIYFYRCYKPKGRQPLVASVFYRKQSIGLARQEWGREAAEVGAGGGLGSSDSHKQTQSDQDIIPTALPPRQSLASAALGHTHQMFGSTSGAGRLSASTANPAADFAGHGTFNNL